MIISDEGKNQLKRLCVNVPIGAAALARSGGDACEQPAAGKLVLQVRVKFLSCHPLGYLALHVLALLLFLCSFSLLKSGNKEMKLKIRDRFNVLLKL
jgi:hypothetical protein